MGDRTCTEPGCDKAYRAKGLCSTHYNQQRCRPDQRHLKITVPCGFCGQPCVKLKTERFTARFCSYSCRDARRAELDDARAMQWMHDRALRLLPVRLSQSISYCEVPPLHPCRLPDPRPRRWTVGSCAECGDWFVERQGQARYCSRLCGRRASRRRWKIKADRLIDPAVRLYVFERDRWICQICHRKVMRSKAAPHPKSPSIDHIVPQSEGVNHDPANLRAAHLLCNALRGAGGGGEQLALIG